MQDSVFVTQIALGVGVSNAETSVLPQFYYTILTPFGFGHEETQIQHLTENKIIIKKHIPVSNMEDPWCLGDHHLEGSAKTDCAHGVD